MPNVNSFLKLMSFLESSDKANPTHQQVQSGLQSGDTAMGKHGLMPNTAKEMAKRNPSSELDNIVQEAPNQNIQPLLEQNPEKQDEYTRSLADHLLTKTQGDPALAAAGWLYGHNLSKEEMQQKLDQDPEYHQRIENAIRQKHLMSEPEPLLPLPEPKKENLFSKIRTNIGRVSEK